MIHVAITADAIDAGAELRTIDIAGAGAVASFSGQVRADDGVEALELEHYPAATETALRRMAEAAAGRWNLLCVRIVHRVGHMVPGETVVFVGTAAVHRGPALEACGYLIDRLKTDAPFWKKELRAAGGRWVEPRGGDAAAAARWQV